MLAFIDESGDCGVKFGKGSSDYFTCVAVVFADNSSADVCDQTINALRLSLKRPNSWEFHFTDCSDKVRQEFLRTVCQSGFTYVGFVIDKRKVYGDLFQNPKQLYEFAVGIVCEQMRSLLRDSKITIDKNGNREFGQNLEKKLKAQMTDLEGRCRIRRVTIEESHSNNLLQLADMVCGAVNRSLTADDDRFRKLILQRERFVKEWPEKDSAHQPILVRNADPKGHYSVGGRFRS